MLIDRTKPPIFKNISSITFPWPQEVVMFSPLPLFVLADEQLPIISLTLLADAGSWHESQSGIAYFTGKMLLEGTHQKSSSQIASGLDYYGAHLAVTTKADYVNITLNCLTKHFAGLVDLLTELLITSNFPISRLEQLQYLKIQSLKIENEKNNFLALRHFKEALLGPDHPYGHTLSIEDVERITQIQLLSYYQHQLFNKVNLLVSGAVSKEDLDHLQHSFAGLPYVAIDRVKRANQPNPATKIQIDKVGGSLQSAICIGKLLLAKNHPDYLPMYVVTMLLGGYFGSRLMRNIREEKGYTYNIYATLLSLRETSYFLVSTEVIQAYTKQTCQEIYKEIEILQTQLVKEKELSTLRNYVLGNFLAHTNDPFSAMQRFKEAHLHGLGQNFYQQLYDVLHQISPTKIKEMATTYLSLDSLTEVIVG